MEFRIEAATNDGPDGNVLFVRLRKTSIGGLVWEGRQEQDRNWTHIAWIDSKCKVHVGGYLDDLKLKRR